MLAGLRAAGKRGEARPPVPHCHLPHPFPAPVPTTFERKGAHSQWGPARVLMAWWPHRLPPAPSLDADFSILGQLLCQGVAVLGGSFSQV